MASQGPSSTDPPTTPADGVEPEPLPWPPMASAMEKLPPRPAPTCAYTWNEASPTARLVYLRDADEANQVLSRLQPGPLGFDLEWKPTYVKGGHENPVALVQLANDDTIHLIQISAMKEFPSKLREILEDGSYVKAGVGIQGDTKKLFTDWGVSVRSCADLSLLARTVDGARWRGKYNVSIGLARLVEIYPYRLLGKGKITRSNWEGWLKPAQQQYAANDAHAGFHLYKLLMAMADQKDLPEAKYYTFDCVRGYYCEPSGLPWYPVNPKYDPGPIPPPKPRKDNPGRKGKEKQPEESAPQQSSEEPEQSDPSVVIQRHESVLKIAHSTWMRQRDAASAQQQDHRKRPRGQHQSAYHIQQPLPHGPAGPPRHFQNQHFRNSSSNSFQGVNPTPPAAQTFEPTSPTLHSPPAQRSRPNYVRQPHPSPNQAYRHGGESASSGPSPTLPRGQQKPPPPTPVGNANQRPPRRPRHRKPKPHVGTSSPASPTPAQA